LAHPSQQTKHKKYIYKIFLHLLQLYAPSTLWKVLVLIKSRRRYTKVSYVKVKQFAFKQAGYEPAQRQSDRHSRGAYNQPSQSEDIRLVVQWARWPAGIAD
jgi:hypothetical protein